MNQTTDKVFLRELAVECIIGFLDWERLVKQTVYLDIEVPVDCRSAAVNDDVEGTHRRRVDRLADRDAARRAHRDQIARLEHHVTREMRQHVRYLVEIVAGIGA